MLMWDRSLLGQSSRYLAMMTRPFLTKLFKGWSTIVVLIPVYDILISSQFRHSSARNWHALNFWLDNTMADTCLLMVLSQWGQSPWNLGEIKKRIKFEVEKVSLEFVKFHQEIGADVQTWFEKNTFNAFRSPVQNGLMPKSQYILHRKWQLACILCTHQKSYKLDEGMMLIFVSGKNRLLILAIYCIW